MADSDSPHGSLQIEIFECSICLQVVKRPKVLSCGHTFCMECLVSLVKESKSLKCPTCQELVKLDKAGRAGVESLTNNILVANLRDDVKTSASRQGRGPQGAENPTAVLDEFLCPSHRGEELKYYCPPCDAAICEECWLGDHNTHGVSRLGKTLQEQTAKAREVSEDGNRLMQQIRGKITELENSKRSLAAEESTQVKAVDETAQKLTADFASEVIKDANALKDELHSFFTHNNRMILERKEKLETHLAQLESSTDSLERRINQGDAIVVFSGRKMLKDLIEQSPKQTKEELGVEADRHNTAVFTPTPCALPEITLGKLQEKERPKIPEKRSKETDEVNGNETKYLRNAFANVLSSPSVRRKGKPALRPFTSEIRKKKQEDAEMEEQPGQKYSYATVVSTEHRGQVSAVSDKPRPITPQSAFDAPVDVAETRMNSDTSRGDNHPWQQTMMPASIPTLQMQQMQQMQQRDDRRQKYTSSSDRLDEPQNPKYNNALESEHQTAYPGFQDFKQPRLYPWSSKRVKKHPKTVMQFGMAMDPGTQQMQQRQLQQSEGRQRRDKKGRWQTQQKSNVRTAAQNRDGLGGRACIDPDRLRFSQQNFEVDNIKLGPEYLPGASGSWMSSSRRATGAKSSQSQHQQRQNSGRHVCLDRDETPTRYTTRTMAMFDTQAGWRPLATEPEEPCQMADGFAPVPSRPKSPPMEKIRRELERLLLRDKADNEKTFHWIEEHVDEATTKGPTFIRALMTVVCGSAIIGEGSSLRCNPKIIQKRVVLLQKYLDNESTRELQALFALQALMVQLDQPPNLLRMFFDTLYDEDVISEDALYAWESNTDPAEQEGKRVALKSLIPFFTLLREAEEEQMNS
ncbi:EIF4G3 [Branchiostoma lanceolatum]|uniref:EIF4G3 protein n=1 Tax=Branchiostoma lanceolatum TaxID=7740 RepID=A0A8J9YR95_BRALA|nr:EIF4G3 [Branchiostoma lanceolatum]